jgi:hypothetical protein
VKKKIGVDVDVVVHVLVVGLLQLFENLSLTTRSGYDKGKAQRAGLIWRIVKKKRDHVRDHVHVDVDVDVVVHVLVVGLLQLFENLSLTTRSGYDKDRIEGKAKQAGII